MQEIRRQESQTRALFVKRIALSVAFLFVGAFIFYSHPVLAQLTQSTANADLVAQAAQVEQQDLLVIIGRIINIFLGTLGVIFLIIVIYAGYLYMTAAGNQEVVKKAITWIKNAVIGLIIIAFSFAIVGFILDWLTGTGYFSGNLIGNNSGNSGLQEWTNSGCLGQSGIAYHYPEPNQNNVPRNTAIVITFMNKVDPASFIKDWTEGDASVDWRLNTEMVKIYPQNSEDDFIKSEDAMVSISDDGRIVMIKPNYPGLGDNSQEMWYKVDLDADIKNASGTAMCGGFSNGYSWSFKTSTEYDNTPPQVLSVFPFTPGPHPKNSIIQITFNEPMLPISVSGFYNHENEDINFMNIVTSAGEDGHAPLVDGQYRISNAYRTVEFVPDFDCGMNTCNERMYCLPAPKSIQVIVKAATLSENGPEAAMQGPFGYDGAVDMAGNSLDGDRMGGATGPGPGLGVPDGYLFKFRTEDEIKRDGPIVWDIDPREKTSNIQVDKNVDVTWDGLLMSDSINPDTVQLLPRWFPAEAEGSKEKNPSTWWFFMKLTTLNREGIEIGPDQEPYNMKMSIVHRPFMPSDQQKAGESVWDSLNLYTPNIKERVKNVYQNCFNPAVSRLNSHAAPNVGNANICNEVRSDIDCSKTLQWLPPK